LFVTVDRVWKSTAKLADGREIIYFDEAPGSGRAEVADTRTLLTPAGQQEASGDAGELRWDPLLGEWVAFAEQRQGRTFLPSTADCPLCPSGPGRATEIPAHSYDVVVFGNRFPALPPGHGRCEVVCFTDEHDASFATLTRRRATTVLAAWADRTAELGGADGIEHVYCFENRGEEVGVTLHHPHGQVYALPFVPPRTQRLLASARRHRATTGGNLFDWLVDTELADGRRLVARNDQWVAFVPSAARWPFEILLFPVQRVPDLVGLTGNASAGFAEVYLDVLRRLDRLFGTPMPYMACWQQAPSRDQDARQELALHLQVMTVLRAPGKLKFRAGTESGADVWSNDVLPERAARMLRAAG
jgi:UDPglucose--hexose-1-phosphate uridylyltransferase